jgi:hypothetical protein
VPSTWLGVLITLLCIAPGWFALVGFRHGRGEPSPSHPLTDGIPALAISTLWSGPLALISFGPLWDWGTATSSSVARAAVLSAALTLLLGVPALFGWVAGRVTRTKDEPQQVSAWLSDGTVVHGFSDPKMSSDSVLVVTDATWENDIGHWTGASVDLPREQVLVLGVTTAQVIHQRPTRATPTPWDWPARANQVGRPRRTRTEVVPNRPGGDRKRADQAAWLDRSTR